MSDNSICKEKHLRVDEKFEHHDKWLQEHEDKIDKLALSDAANTMSLNQLCKQLSDLTKAMWTLAISIGSVVIAAILAYIFKIGG